ncbi:MULTISPECIES: Abi family protein [Saccharomonospora]|uniref:Abi-like protein n=2 Tax=Saccharomonospora TaxID=1851 RepID=H5XFW8_9PSEU|nr:MULTISPECIES: Abi family protein [Saccharomonospora]EHR61524.1 Abi-like protein [Saccharomonospora cyanea NA-134]EHY87417.1 Abi-like protein [Saccharomonospora azurea NA-128]
MTAGEQTNTVMAATAQGARSTLSMADLQSWLSAPRLNTYLAACNQDRDLALELYCWNSQLAAAALVDTCHLEVALRNAYDRELSKRFPNWSVDPDSDLFRRTQGHGRAVTKQVELNKGSVAALTAAKRGLGATPNHGKVLAATTFGFWVKLTDRDRTATFWTPMLRRAFHGTPTRGEVHERVARINKFRNRLAHNEPVFSTTSGLHDRLRDIEELFDWVAPSAAAHVRATSTVPSLIAQCPVSGLL